MKLLPILLAIGAEGKKPNKFEELDRSGKIMMKKAIAEGLLTSSTIKHTSAAGPNIGTIRSVPNSLKKQQICMDIPTVAEIRSAKKSNPQEAQLKKRITLKTIQAVMDGSYEEWMHHLTQNQYPAPTLDLPVEYSHEQFDYLDLGKDMVDIGENSFTLASIVRLRPDPSIPADYVNRGSRILSARNDAGQGFELVAPSFYTGSVSMFLGNSVKEPGHLDFGRSRLPDNTWLCIGTSVDRENFGKDTAHIVPFVNGFSDGPGTSIKMSGSLSSNASMILGNGLDDEGNLMPGRRDRRFEEKPRFGQQFQGDISSVLYWDRALTHKELRMMCRQKLADVGIATGKCPKGYEQFDCRCYKVVDHELMSFKDADKFCRAEGAKLARPKTEQQQDFLEILMQQSHLETFWIGIDDIEIDGMHVWSDGTVLDYARGHFNRYPTGHPDKVYTSEDCVEEIKSRSGFYWNDENCFKANAFACELDAAVERCEPLLTPPPAVLPMEILEQPFSVLKSAGIQPAFLKSALKRRKGRDTSDGSN